MTVAVFYYMFIKIVASLSFSFSPFLTFVSLHGRFSMKSLMILPKNYFNVTLFRSTVVLSKHHTPRLHRKRVHTAPVQLSTSMQHALKIQSDIPPKHLFNHYVAAA